MALDPVTAIANAISSIAGVAQPFIDQAVAQKYENEFTDNIAEINQALANLDPSTVDALVLRLIGEAGQTIGGVGEIVGISVGKLAAILAIVAGKIKDDHLLANIQFKQNSPGS